MIKLRIKTSQLKPHITGWKGQMTLYVNDLYTKGLKYGMLCTTETGTADGEDKPVLRYAGTASATYTDIAEGSVVLAAKPANGIIYDTSARDLYASELDLTDETRLFPYGRRQQDGIVMLDEAVYEITDTDDIMGTSLYFRTVDKVFITAGQTGVVFDNTAKTIVIPGKVTGVRVGEKIGTASATTYVAGIAYASLADTTTITLVAGLGNAVIETKLLATVFDTLYSTADMNGEVPFQLIPNGNAIGKVVSGIAAHIKI